MASWSNLNRDIQEAILHKLSLEEMQNCVAVCKQWRQLYKTRMEEVQAMYTNFRCPAAPNLPQAMLEGLVPAFQTMSQHLSDPDTSSCACWVNAQGDITDRHPPHSSWENGDAMIVVKGAVDEIQSYERQIFPGMHWLISVILQYREEGPKGKPIPRRVVLRVASTVNIPPLRLLSLMRTVSMGPLLWRAKYTDQTGAKLWLGILLTLRNQWWPAAMQLACRLARDVANIRVPWSVFHNNTAFVIMDPHGLDSLGSQEQVVLGHCALASARAAGHRDNSRAFLYIVRGDSDSRIPDLLIRTILQIGISWREAWRVFRACSVLHSCISSHRLDKLVQISNTA
eukprot:jgi/Botrbrau1/14879/Bobra.0298s0011.2